MKLIGRVEPVLHLQGYLNTVPGGVYAPEDETNVTYIVRDKTGEEVPSELVEEESTAATKIIQLLVAIGGSTTDEELAEIEAEVDRLLNETDPVELGNLAGHSIVNKIRLAQTYRDDVISAIEEKGISAADEQPFRTVADLVKQIIRQAKTVTPTTEEQIITPDDGVYGLESVTVEGVQLQEINVWSTDTEQVITPDEGYMGFSKVIVEAVDISGGDGGGDYPGEGDGGDDDYPGGGDSVILPDVNDNEYGSEDNYTGYSYYNLALLPTFPAEELAKHPYALLTRANYANSVPGDGYWMFLSPGPFLCRKDTGSINASGAGNLSDGSPGNTSQRYDLSGDTWQKGGLPGGYAFEKKHILWANHTIYYEESGAPFYYGFSAIPQVSKDSSGTEQYAKVSDSEMNALAVSTQNITGTTETMNMRQVITELDAYTNDTWEGGSY